jgi:hypothetical protein
MSQYRIVLILDDTVPVQATLLGQIQAQLSSIAGNLPPSTMPQQLLPLYTNVEVRKLA